MPRPVPLRGVIEGFYGQPWSPTDRLAVIEFLAERGMNAYVYAPKSDPKHRDRWRDAYDAAELGQFRTLAEHAAQQGTRFGFALSPGLDIDYRSDPDRDALLAKLAPLLDAGVQWVVLALDDIPNRPRLAVEQTDLTAWLLDALRGRQPDLHLTLVPTEYVGTRPTSYLEGLAAELPSDVDVMWTGPTVCSPVIRAADARARASALAGRRPLLWDNYPVNDGTMEPSLHLGPYRGREPELTDELDGVLCNPMLQPHASEVALATAADFLSAPENYDPAASWSRAIAAVGKSRAPALRALAAACADGPLLAPEHLEANVLVTALVDAAGGPAWPEAVRALRDHLAAAQDARRAWADAGDEPLAGELEPWLGAAVIEGEAGLAALRLVQQTYPVARISPDGNGKAFGPDAEAAMVHAFATVFSWSAARRRKQVVFGPRFAFYPAVIQLDDGRPGLDVDLAVVEDRSAIDRLCRFALARYQARAQRPPDTLRVTADGAPAAVEPGGSFSAPGAHVVVVAAGPDSTEISSADGTLPFPDVRLA
ncbi:MAG TPA: beta-N-acetylglucosaminidase domain-containing protein [Acidimicrobiia bacterium]|nr:beta-N-acetylglucosaminidase domain-containing protein [Acidimicrobiia bacterium]